MADEYPKVLVSPSGNKRPVESFREENELVVGAGYRVETAEEHAGREPAGELSRPTPPRPMPPRPDPAEA